MKKFVSAAILVFAIALMAVACGSAEKKDEKKENCNCGAAVSDDWIGEWIKSNSSDDEICTVGESQVPERFGFQGIWEAQQSAQTQLCGQIATSSRSRCNLPPVKMKGQRQSQYADTAGRISVYVLMCVDRKDLEEKNKESEKEASGTDKTDQADKTNEDKVVQ